MAESKDRVKASYIRKRVEAGKASEDQLAWLAGYERNKPAGSRGPTAPRRAERPLEGPAAPMGDPAPDDAPEAGFARVLDYGAPTNPDGHTLEGDAPCAIKDCPRCKLVSGSQLCTTTNERVWPRMKPDAAKGLAGSLLSLVCLAARMFGKNVEPLPEEIDSFARALTDLAYYRAGWMSAGGDFFAVGYVLVCFGARVWNAPKVERKLPA